MFAQIQFPELTEVFNTLTPMQEWFANVKPLEMAFKGLIIGISVSCPMGPVGVMIVQRTLNKGRWAGFATGVGAALSDFVYALLTGLAMGFIVDVIENVQIAFWFKIICSLVIFVFGFHTFRNIPVKKEVKKKVKNRKKDKVELEAHGNGNGVFFTNLLTGFLMTFSNPVVVPCFITFYGQYTFIIDNNPIPQTVGYLFIIVGALLWWFGLTWLLSRMDTSNSTKFLLVINRIIGIIFMAVGGLMAIYTLTGHSFPGMM